MLFAMESTVGSPKVTSLELEKQRGASSPTGTAAPMGEFHHQEPLPFFIFDWLEKIKPDDLSLAQQMLKTPNKDRPVRCSSENDVNPRNLFTANQDHQQSPMIRSTSQESPFRKRSISIGNGYNAKGLQKARMGRWEDALACWENALEIRRQVLGETHIDTANTMNNLGIALGKLNRCEEALAYLDRAFRIRMTHYGYEHEEVAVTLHNIGNVRHQAGEMKAAIAAFNESKNLLERKLGNANIQVARACVASGHIYYEMGNYHSARDAYTEARSIFYHAGVSRDDAEMRAVMSDIQELERLMRNK